MSSFTVFAEPQSEDFGRKGSINNIDEVPGRATNKASYRVSNWVSIKTTDKASGGTMRKATEFQFKVFHSHRYCYIMLCLNTKVLYRQNNMRKKCEFSRLIPPKSSCL